MARSGRFAIAVCGAALTGALALALPGDARPARAPAAAPAAIPPAATVEVLRSSQARILETGRLKGNVFSSEPGSVKVRGRAGSADQAATKVAKSRWLRFAERGTKRFSLRLTAAGRDLLEGCEPTLLTLRSRLKPAGAGDSAPGGNRDSSTVEMQLDAASCPSPGTTPGGGGGAVAPADADGDGVADDADNCPALANGGQQDLDGDGSGDACDPNTVPPAQEWTGPDFDAGPSFSRCDFLDDAVCLQPWPNDYFTTEDGETDTGRRVSLQSESMPKNQPLGLPLPVKPIDPTEHNRADGFSPGSMLITRVPGLDNPAAFENTGAVSIDRPERYDDPDQPVVVIDAATGERHPVWAEIDFNPLDPASGGGDTPGNRADVNLIVRPLVNFEEGRRYVVALRGLKDENGEGIEAADAFRVYRDNLVTEQAPVESRRAHMEELFEILGDSGIARSNLYLAWDFTVASERSISERMLTIRDEAFSQLGDDDLADGAVSGDAPAVTVDAVEDFTPEQDSRIAREVTGTIEVPCFMKPSCGPNGATYNLGPDGLPEQTGTADVEFICQIPRAALDDANSAPARASLYGHGLLGADDEVRAGNVKSMADEHNFVFCATDWYGFAEQNLINILLILQDLSQFPTLVDPTQQGFLNFLYLGRAMIHPEGLISDPAFQGADGDDPGDDPDPLIDTTELFFDGNSQGGILGGALTALAPDFRRAVLGVPGINYSTLLRRSVDFEPYSEGKFGPILEEAICDQLDAIPVPEVVAVLVPVCANLVPDDTPLGLYDNYPNELERPLILALMQMLWDRGDPNGYAHHMTDDPLPNTPSHEVLLHAAFGDHQVANVAAEVEARTIGAGVYQPALDPTDSDPGDPQRHWEADGSSELFAIPAITSFPYDGSALVYWDGGPLGFDDPFDPDGDNDGTATPPDENIPPRPSEGFGADPHSYPRSDVKARAQKSAFLSPGGVLRNPCTTTNNLVDPPQPIAFETGTPIPCYANGWLGPGSP